MKRNLSLLLIPVLFFMAQGCGTLAPEGPYQGDKVLYDADYAIANSYETIHSFVKWEYQNRQGLIATPQIKHTADQMRIQAPSAFAAALSARDAYANNPSSANKTALTSALAVLHSLVRSSLNYVTLMGTN